ncbi:MAG: BREX-3 system P-loop-containing protein BrxF [Bacteroidia bacterium]|nr:BREX-3 system P-loop-containing protein BrxF [Bacteroidia bacterium]
MSGAIQSKIKTSLVTADSLYHRLVLVVGENKSGKSAVLRDVANKFNMPVTNVNLEISALLLDLTNKQRSLRLPGLLGEILNNAHPFVILDNIEILFDKDLKQDPLRILQGISRNHSVIASWGGYFSNGRLQYAEPGHSEYRNYESVGALIVTMDGWATIDSENINEEAGQA